MEDKKIRAWGFVLVCAERGKVFNHYVLVAAPSPREAIEEMKAQMVERARRIAHKTSSRLAMDFRVEVGPVRMPEVEDTIRWVVQEAFSKARHDGCKST